MLSHSNNSRPDHFFPHSRTFPLLATTAVVTLLLAIIGFITPAPSTVQAAPALQQTSCTNGFSGDIQQDTTWSGEMYLDGNVKVENGATLTIAAGTSVVVCGNHTLRVSNGVLMAEGTADNPITFAADAATTNWNSILLGGTGSSVGESVLRHVTLQDGGGQDATSNNATVYIDAYSGTTGNGPVLEHVTVQDSNTYGIVVEMEDGDTIAMSNLTISGSGRAAMRIAASAMRGLGTGNSFSDNTPDRIQVYGQRLFADQTWPAQPVPYEIESGISIRQGDDDNTTITIEPGADFRLRSGVTIDFNSYEMIAEGTADNPITFDAVNADAHWNSIALGGTGSTIGESSLRYVTMRNGGGNDATNNNGALYVDAYSGTTGKGPVIDHLTIEQSGAYGLVVEMEDSDAITISNTTITGSARAAMRIAASTMSALGEGNSFSNNTPDTIQVYGQRLFDDQTWPAQPVPYEIESDISIRQGDDDDTTITIEPGTQFLMRSDVTIDINSYHLIAAGTPDAPITFDAKDPAAHWKSLVLGGTASVVSESLLRHVVLRNGGGNVYENKTGALYIDAYDGTTGDGPTVEHVTIENSRTYGLYIDIEDSDSLTTRSMTITDSYHAPIYMSAAAMSHLGRGNAFSNNGNNAIETWNTTLYYSQTILKQPVPYELLGGFSVQKGVENATSVITIEAGTDFWLRENASIDFNSERLIAEGTADERITFAATDPQKPWEAIYFGGAGHTASNSVLRYVTLRNGGGEDTLEDRLGGRGMIDIYDLDGTPVAGPIMEHVAIYGSTSYGIFMDQEDSDDTPPILNNLTITGTARAPLGMYVAAAGGLGTGNTFVDNEQNVIEIRAGTVAGGRMNYDQTWPKQPVPYQLVSDFGPLAVRDAVLTIEPGTTIQMEEGMGFRVGEGTLLANGTPTEPITFTRASENAGQWGNILLISNIDPPASFSYVSLLHAQGDGGAINHQAGQLKLDHVTAKFNQNAGVYSQGDFVQIKDSVFQLNRQGIRLQHGAGGLLRRNDISNNTEAGLVIQDNDDVCVDALQNYWGSPNGPSDTSSSEDACGSTATNDSSGDSISDGALYSPWLSSLDGQRQGASRISPAEFWVIANGVQSTTLDITVRDAQGVPLADKEIALETTRGTIAQPTAPTDENGVTTARISSEEVGEAIITARNVTDNESLSAMAAVYFWRGGGDTAGLIDQSGAPYASPNLILEGLPFQRGQAMTFRLPMENSNADAAVVEVDYAVSGLGIGRSFGTVDVVSKTLQPGEAWDAAGGWIVDVEGHHCVQARVKVTLPEQRVLQEVVNVGPFQVNFDVPDDPCKEQDVKKLIPRSGGLKGVRKHMTKLLIQTYLVKECLNQTLSFSSVQSNGQHSTPAQDNDGEREHDVVTTVPEYTPATFEANDELTQAKADALNTLAQVVADLSALDDAIATTNQRIKWAGQANDEEAEARQFAAYRGFKQQYAQKLFDLAESIQTILSLTRDADEPDTFFTPEDYQDYRRQLRTAGYTQDTLSYHQEFGLSNELIDAIREEEIDRLAEQGSSTTTFYSFLETVREGAQARAEDLQEQYGSGEASAGLAAENPTLFTLSPLQSTFTVANPRDEQHTVNLKVRPVDLPLSWSYELDTSAPTLAAGETTTVTLTLSPGDGGQAVEGSTVRVAVEGFIDGEYIGGVLLQQRTPWTPETLAQREEPAAAGDVYLPLIRK